jgi:hypothetical protein
MTAMTPVASVSRGIANDKISEKTVQHTDFTEKQINTERVFRFILNIYNLDIV